jgi:hypothetical protein
MIPDGIHIVKTTVHGFRFLVIRVSCAGVKAASARSDKKQALALACDWQRLHRGDVIRDHTKHED